MDDIGGIPTGVPGPDPSVTGIPGPDPSLLAMQTPFADPSQGMPPPGVDFTMPIDPGLATGPVDVGAGAAAFDPGFQAFQPPSFDAFAASMDAGSALQVDPTQFTDVSGVSAGFAGADTAAAGPSALLARPGDPLYGFTPFDSSEIGPYRDTKNGAWFDGATLVLPPPAAPIDPGSGAQDVPIEFGPADPGILDVALIPPPGQAIGGPGTDVSGQAGSAAAGPAGSGMPFGSTQGPLPPLALAVPVTSWPVAAAGASHPAPVRTPTLAPPVDEYASRGVDAKPELPVVPVDVRVPDNDKIDVTESPRLLQEFLADWLVKHLDRLEAEDRPGAPLGDAARWQRILKAMEDDGDYRVVAPRSFVLKRLYPEPEVPQDGQALVADERTREQRFEDEGNAWWEKQQAENPGAFRSMQAETQRLNRGLDPTGGGNVRFAAYGAARLLGQDSRSAQATANKVEAVAVALITVLSLLRGYRDIRPGRQQVPKFAASTGSTVMATISSPFRTAPRSRAFSSFDSTRKVPLSTCGAGLNYRMRKSISGR